jgi:hypothetical protein
MLWRTVTVTLSGSMRTGSFMCSYASQDAIPERREERHVQALLVGRKAAQDITNIADEAEVEHAIGLSSTTTWIRQVVTCCL